MAERTANGSQDRGAAGAGCSSWCRTSCSTRVRSSSEVARLFGAQPDQLRRDLDLLFMSGLPPYGPGDLIDVDVDEDEHIWITMADHFARPLRLTRNEALALYLRGTELAATPGVPDAPALESALEKLRCTLGPETFGSNAEDDRSRAGRTGARAPGGDPPGGTRPRPAGDRVLRPVQARVEHPPCRPGSGLLRDGQLVRGRLGRGCRRRTAPAGRPHPACGAARGTASRLEICEGAGRALYTPAPSDVPVRLRLRPSARWVERVLRHDRRHRGRRRLPRGHPAGRGRRGVARLLLRLGSAAEALEPDRPCVRPSPHSQRRHSRRYR